MYYRNVQLPRAIHTGAGMISRIPEICDSLNLQKNITLATGPTTKKIAADKVEDLLEDDSYNVNELIIKKGTYESVAKLTEESEDTGAILAVGGGKIIDVSKMSATENKIPVLSIPTTAAHDGIVSPRASIKDNKKTTSLKTDAPFAVVADTQIIAQAPHRFLASGFADIISNLTAIEDWKLSAKLTNEPYSDSAAALSTLTAQKLIDQADKIKPNRIESAEIVVKGLISSGIAMSIAGSSRPASGSEHKFSHALDRIAEKPALHGEQCGVGTIMMMYLQGGNYKQVRSALKKAEAPVNAEQLNIPRGEIIEALTKAHEIRRERYTILGDRGLTREAAENLARKTMVIE